MKNEAFPYAFFEGKIVGIEDAKISIMTNALQYGTGIFGGIRGYYNRDEKFISIFRIDDHIKRFLTSINILGCGFAYKQEEIKEIFLKLIAKNNPKADTYFRPFAYVGHTRIGPNFINSTLDFALYMLPMGEYLPVDKGLSAAVSSWTRVSENSLPPRAKIAGAYVNSALARQEAFNNGYDEAILLNGRGNVCEGSAENIFIVRDGVLITPGPSEDILEGISRRSILQVARDLNIPVEVRSISRTELYTCDEAFFTGTGVQMSWIAKIDKRQVGDGKRGKVTAQLQDKYFKILRGEDKEYSNWCTKIKIK